MAMINSFSLCGYIIGYVSDEYEHDSDIKVLMQTYNDEYIYEIYSDRFLADKLIGVLCETDCVEGAICGHFINGSMCADDICLYTSI